MITALLIVTVTILLLLLRLTWVIHDTRWRVMCIYDLLSKHIGTYRDSPYWDIP